MQINKLFALISILIKSSIYSLNFRVFCQLYPARLLVMMLVSVCCGIWCATAVTLCVSCQSTAERRMWRFCKNNKLTEGKLLSYFRCLRTHSYSKGARDMCLDWFKFRPGVRKCLSGPFSKSHPNPGSLLWLTDNVYYAASTNKKHFRQIWLRLFEAANPRNSVFSWRRTSHLSLSSSRSKSRNRSGQREEARDRLMQSGHSGFGISKER